MVLWSLASLWKSIIADATCTASRWYLNWWSWWAKALQAMQVDVEAHLRKLAPTSQANPEE
eukprot:5229053-Lingulodinium_polyedra.AAC.1